MAIAQTSIYGYSGWMEHEPILNYVLRRLAESRGRYKEIAERSGVPYSTLSKIAQRVTPNPGVLHVQALADYFRSAEPSVVPLDQPPLVVSEVAE